MKCCICSSENTVLFLKVYDDRFGYPGTFSIFSCNACDHKFLNTEFPPEELTRLYTEYYPRSQYSLDLHRPYVELTGFKAWFDGAKYSAFRWVPPNVRILDIGCGFGEALGYHKARGCDVYGVEADENIRRVADKFGYKVQVGLFDPKLYEPESFDYITMDQVVEHVTDPVKMLRDVAGVMKSSGRLIVSTPNAGGWGARLFGRRWINWHAPYHLQFFSEESMRLAAEQAGLVLERVETVTCSDWLYLQWNHLSLFPAMGEQSMFWKPFKKRSGTQMLMKRLILLVHWTKVNHILTRFFDMLGIGDNYIFVLKNGR